VTAAKMMASVPGKVLADDAKGEAGADKAAAFDIEGVLKKAEDLAQGDELITKVAGRRACRSGGQLQGHLLLGVLLLLQWLVRIRLRLLVSSAQLPKSKRPAAHAAGFCFA
jgi:hypothetical protein